ncbi:GH18 family chitinase [Pseudoduganella flava]|uniref:chitinase n=1 Tax=Pseudoduganella flava TaxID=871742 RepID=A0A562Q4E5_9BURK|nr:GH18 family chitinase [Pseudoduganella flava]
MLVTLAALAGCLAGSAAAATNAAPVPVPRWEQFPGEPIIVFGGGDSTDPDGHVIAWTWKFGDGQTGSGPDAAHMYAKAGSYQATLTVQDDQGASASKTFAVTVQPKPNMLPEAAGTASAVPATLTANFDASASRDPDGRIVTYLWAFGDGTQAKGAKLAHAYKAAGTYAATLTVTDDRGGIAKLNVPVTVVGNLAPVAAASTRPVSGKLAIEFDAAASTDSDGSIARYVWNFGDGTSGTGVYASHTYAQAGHYTATLTVTDNLGKTASLALPVDVTGATIANTPWVTGYYAGWFWNDYQPQHIDMSAMTHVVFGRVAPGGGTLGGKPGEIMRGAGTAHEPGHLPANVSTKSVEDYLVQRAHGAGIKALLMLGGNDDGAGFAASTTAAMRQTFIANLLNYLAAHDYDGVDVDWEDRLETAADQQQLIALITELKAAAAFHARYRDRPLLVTWPTSILNMNYDVVPPWKVQVAQLVDQFNIMTYEMAFGHGGWTTWHFAPIGGQSGTHPSDISSTVQAYVDAGILPAKIGIGIGFYGLSYTPPATGPNQVVTLQESNDATWSYANLVNGGFLAAGTYVWDDVAQMGYRSYPGGFTGHAQYNWGTSGFLSYEDPASIAAKGKWVRGKGLGGTVLWTINYGSPDGLNNPLLNAVKQSFLLGADSVQPFARMTSAMPSASVLRIDFDGSASRDVNDQPVTGYAWNFGDGASAAGATVGHTYAQPGDYLVTLTVTDAAGVSASTAASVRADFPPPPDTLPPLEPVPAANGALPWVTAYYAGWFWPDYAPQYVDMSALTHYVFGRVAPGGGTLGGQPGDVVKGGGTAHDAGTLGTVSPKSVEDYLVEKAHVAGRKALLMIGGMGDGQGFLRSTAPSVRPAFVKNVLDYLEAHDYDGIDVDWEDVLDTEQAHFRLTALIADLRAGAKLRTRWQDGSFLITFPNYAMNMNYETVPAWKVTIASLVDQFNLMSYALGFAADGWSTTTFSPIEGHTASHPMDLASSLQAYQNAGIDRRKLGIGIGFYGMSYAPPVTGLDQPVTALSSSDTAWSWANLVNGGFLSHGTYHWDDTAKMGYRVYPGGYQGTAQYNREISGMLTYEDENSIAAKGSWVRATGAGGAIIWTINYGSADGRTNPLMNAVKGAFLK